MAAHDDKGPITDLRATPQGVIEVRRTSDGLHHRHCLEPGADIAAEDPLVVAKAEEVWTPETVATWQSRQIPTP